MFQQLRLKRRSKLLCRQALALSPGQRSDSVEVSYFNWAEDDSIKFGRQENGKRSRIGLQNRGDCGRYPAGFVDFLPQGLSNLQTFQFGGSTTWWQEDAIEINAPMLTTL
jgi:hypothetical protein